MKRVMIYIGVLIVGLSWTVLYTYLCYRLFGSVATLVIIGIEEFYKLKYCSTVVYMVPRA